MANEMNQTAVLKVLLNGKEAEDEIQKLSKKAETLSRQIENMGKNGIPNGLETKLKSTNDQIKALSGGVVTVSKTLDNLSTAKPKELRQTLLVLNKQLQFSGIKRGSEEWNRLQAAIGSVQQELKKIKNETKTTGTALENTGSKVGEIFKSGLASFLGNIYTKAADALGRLVSAAVEWTKEGIRMAAAAEGVKTAFDKLGAPNLLQNLQTATKGLLSDFDLMKYAVRAENFRIPLDQLGNLLKFAQQRAQETGESVEFLANSIITGLGRKSALVLDNLGISAAELQAQTKKTGDFASAALGIINRELEKQGDLALTSADKAQQASIKWQNAQTAVGGTLLWLSNLWHSFSGSVADGITKIAGNFTSVEEQLQKQTKTVVNLKRNIEPLLAEYDALATKTNLSATEQQRLEEIIKTITGAMPGAASAHDQYGKVIAINTERVRAYIKAQSSLMAFNNRELIKEKGKEKNELDRQFKKAKANQIESDATGSYTISDTRYKNLQGHESGRLIRATQAQVEENNILVAELIVKKQELENEIEILSGDYLLKELQRAEEEEKIAQKRLQTEEEYSKKSIAELRKLAKAGDELAQKIYNDKVKNLESDIDLQKKQTLELEKIILSANPIEAENHAYDERLKAAGLFGVERKNMTEKQLEAIEILEQKHTENIQKIIDSDPLQAQILELEKLLESTQKIHAPQSNDAAALTAPDIKKYDRQLADDTKKLADNRAKNLITEGAYYEKLLLLQQNYLKKKLALEDLAPDDFKALSEQLKTIDQTIAANRNNERKNALSTLGLEDTKTLKEQELAIIADYEARGIITKEEALKAKKILEEKYLKQTQEKITESLQSIASVTTSISNTLTAMQNAELQAIDDKYAAEIAAAGNNQKKLKTIEEKKQKEQNAIRAKYADKQFIVTVAQVISETALAAMKSYEAMAGIPVVGPALGAIAAAAAVAAGAAQIATAKQQQIAAKKGYSKGGFTEPGPRTDVAGVVHRGEFVANSEAVANPATRRVLNMIDLAQRNNTVGSLTERDFARALDYRQSERSALISGISSAVSSSPRADDSPTLNALAFWLEQNSAITNLLSKRLKEPFIGEVSITGSRGFEENWERYQKMKSNATR
jgi:hypothetical protein